MVWSISLSEKNDGENTFEQRKVVEKHSGEKNGVEKSSRDKTCGEKNLMGKISWGKTDGKKPAGKRPSIEYTEKLCMKYVSPNSILDFHVPTSSTKNLSLLSKDTSSHFQC